MAVVLNFLLFLTSLYSTSCIEPIYKLNNEIVKQYKLPDLPFDYADLEPYIDRETVIVHHQGHHAAYTKKLNAALNSWRQENSSVIID